MAFPPPFTPLPYTGSPNDPNYFLNDIYYPTPICIGDDTSKIQFTGVLGEPVTLPEMDGDVNCKIFFMRQGSGQPGNRVFLHRGGSVNYRDIEFSSIVTPNQLTQLTTWFELDPTTLLPSVYAFAYSPDNGAQNYDALWQKKGLIQKNIEFNQRIFTRVTIKLHILGLAVSLNLTGKTIIS